MLKQILVTFLAGIIAVSSAVEAQQAAPAGGTVKVRKQTVLKFATVQPLGSATAKAGDDVPLRLTQAFVLNGVTLLPEGTVVHGRVTKVKQPKPSCRNGEVEWKLDRIALPSGSTAFTDVGFVSPQADAEIPKYVHSKDHRGPVFWGVGAPIITAVVAPFVVVMSPYLAAVELDHRCPGEGNQYRLPANATVGVVVWKDARVRY